MPTREEKIAELNRLDKIAELKAMDQASSEPSMSVGASTAHGLGQGVSFGFSDELVGAGKAITGEGGSLKERYVKGRDEYRNTLAKAEQDNPVAFRVGDAGGAIATSFVPGLGVAKGAKLLSTLGKVAISGGIAGAGYSNADVTKGPDSLYGLGKDIGQGAAIGAGSQLAFSGVGKLLSKTPDALRQAANERAVKAATGSSVSNIRKIAGVNAQSPGDITKIEKKISQVGKELLDSGAVKFWDKVEDIAPKLAAKKDEAGKKIAAIADKIDEIAPKSISAKKIADEMVDYATKIPSTASGQSLQNKILAEAASIEKMGGLNFKEAQAIKNQYKFKPGASDAYFDNQDVTNALKGIVGKNMSETADSLAGMAKEETKALISSYKKAKTDYGAFKSTSEAASGRVLQNLSNRFVSPSDYGVGAAAAIASGGLSLAGTAKAALAGAANNQLRQRGSSAAAVTLNKLANKMENSSEFAKKFGQYFIDAAKQGPDALMITHQSLLQYPEYKKALEENKNGIKLPEKASSGLKIPQGRN